MNLSKQALPQQAAEGYSPRVKPVILRMVEEPEADGDVK